ncbi:MAG TPA: minichromosome maintenance protein MCM [Candidatus Thermoplasmatota archaeon]|nr:minichromosome maintenance protein MCM [Candidatus Thermoplasmatota archaeon]
MSPVPSVQLTVQDAQLAAKWDSFLQDYMKAQVQQAALDYPETRSVTVAFNDIQLRDPDLANYLLHKPGQSLRLGAQVLHQMDVTVEPRPKLHLRITGLPDSQRIIPRNLRAEHLGKFLAVEGLVKKVTEVRPTVQEAVFECKVCTTQVRILQDDEFLSEPVLCETCDAQRPWRFVEEESRYLDHQKVEIQEAPEGLRGGSQPERLTIHLTDDLVHRVAPGDRIRMNGILTTQARRQGSQKRVEFNKILNGVSIEVQQQEFSEVQYTAEEEDEICTLGEDPAIYDRLRASFAPTIYGLDVEKDALILSLFGGVEKTYKDGSRSRGDIHVLLVGDPGVAKSQLLRYLSKLAPRAIFTSGKGASAAGLTAAAVKDEFGEGQWTLEAGALVLADKGIACIDELDKMDKNDQSSMHQAMEQQEISIAKAGISATLKSRCAVIGAANPKLGRFDEFTPIHEQINMPPALLSRFDLIFSLLDKPGRDKDNQLAGHLLKTHQAGEVREHRLAHPGGAYTMEDEERLMRRVKPDLSAELLRKYVAYAKRNVFPVLSEEALATIQQYYVNLRNSGDGSIPFTARQLEAFVRLAEASARIRLSQEADLRDAQRAIHIVESYLKSVGVDRETGKFDIDVIATGVSHSQHDRMRILLDIVRTLAKNDKGYAAEDDIVREASKQGITPDLARKSLETMHRNGSIFAKGGAGKYAPLSN